MSKTNKKGYNCKNVENSICEKKELTEEERTIKNQKAYDIECEIGFWLSILCWIIMFFGHCIGAFPATLIAICAVQGIGSRKHIKAVIGLILAIGLVLAGMSVAAYNNALMTESQDIFQIIFNH